MMKSKMLVSIVPLSILSLLITNRSYSYNEIDITPVIYLVGGNQPHIAYKNDKVTSGGYDEKSEYLTKVKSIPLDLTSYQFNSKNSLSIETFTNNSFCKSLQLTIHEQQILFPQNFPALTTSTSCRFRILSSGNNSVTTIVKTIKLIFNYTVQGWRSSLGDGTEAQTTANLINDNDLNSTSLNLNSIEQRLNNFKIADMSPITSLPELQKLYVSGHNIKIIPDAIMNLTNLTELYLSNNKISTIPKNVKYLTKLKKLSLVNNEIKRLPVELSNLIMLKRLYLSGNKITNTSQYLKRLIRLKELDLSNNKLKKIPEFIGRLTYLTDLDLSGNQIVDVPSFDNKLTDLTDLDLSGNQIVDVPSSIGNLKYLERLDLSDNKIKSVPENIGNLTKLTHLDLGENQIENIPSSIDNLINLKKLYLNNNQITDIPANISDLNQLETLDLSYNEIRGAPNSFENLFSSLYSTKINIKGTCPNSK